MFFENAVSLALISISEDSTKEANSVKMVSAAKKTFFFGFFLVTFILVIYLAFPRYPSLYDYGRFGMYGVIRMLLPIAMIMEIVVLFLLTLVLEWHKRKRQSIKNDETIALSSLYNMATIHFFVVAAYFTWYYGELLYYKIDKLFLSFIIYVFTAIFASIAVICISRKLSLNKARR